MSKDIFSKLANTSANNKSDYIKKGAGRAVIIECLKKDTPSNEDVFVARLKILESRGKDGSIPNSPGDKVGWIQLMKKHPSALSNVKSFVLNVLGVKEASVKPEEFIETFEDMINYVPNAKSDFNGRTITAVQAARGMLIDFDTYDQLSRAQKAAGTGVPNTYVKWSHVTDQGDIAARRAELDKTDPTIG